MGLFNIALIALLDRSRQSLSSCAVPWKLESPASQSPSKTSDSLAPQTQGKSRAWHTYTKINSNYPPWHQEVSEKSVPGIVAAKTHVKHGVFSHVASNMMSHLLNDPFMTPCVPDLPVAAHACCCWHVKHQVLQWEVFQRRPRMTEYHSYLESFHLWLTMMTVKVGDPHIFVSKL